MNLGAPFSRFCLSAVTLATAAFVSSAVAGPTNVPFKASVVTQEVLGYNPDCASFTGGRTIGNGVASHFGSVNFVATDCVNPGASQFVFSNGALTLTAANGDTLSASYDGVLTPNWQPNSLSALSGLFTVTGGTGRFSRAAGSGYLQGSENLATGQGHFELTGRISY